MLHRHFMLIFSFMFVSIYDSWASGLGKSTITTSKSLVFPMDLVPLYFQDATGHTIYGDIGVHLRDTLNKHLSLGPMFLATRWAPS